ncbi:hypothetical protein amb3945 [Paramagnetospirillum magneticum AMB-1]|uniref:Uncharacterized protein n=1 Tax=Paramagnetospirillum magneticum (strain ATCC 700264 / AMB-1) TaxID=342108 RepID=Q2W076_PARM1|nr:hypothetical protein amb3945 [Paramagnetospirillum magneticum AMB-1]
MRSGVKRLRAAEARPDRVSHHRAEPPKIPATSRPVGRPTPGRPMGPRAAKTPATPKMVPGLVMVMAKVDRKSRSMPGPWPGSASTDTAAERQV